MASHKGRERTRALERSKHIYTGTVQYWWRNATMKPTLNPKILFWHGFSHMTAIISVNLNTKSERMFKRHRCVGWSCWVGQTQALFEAQTMFYSR